MKQIQAFVSDSLNVSGCTSPGTHSTLFTQNLAPDFLREEEALQTGERGEDGLQIPLRHLRHHVVERIRLLEGGRHEVERRGFLRLYFGRQFRDADPAVGGTA